ncbi:MAG: iron ABC transporter permease [Nocardioides sp.]|uniref:FecCD family ABC transporter permease n=1 Tax=Nocardioides sp. TaxID=35761 RepID=UPI0039E4C1A4
MSALASAPKTSFGLDRARRHPVVGLVVVLVALAITAVLSLAVGARSIAPGTVLHVLFSPDGSDASTVIHQLRVPRTMVALGAGLCLGAAGALMQGHTRNPLAEPGLLGVSSGASLAVVLGITLLHVTSPAGYAWFALVGAGAAAVAVFAIGSGRRGPDAVSLVLAGAAVSALLSAFTQAVILRDEQTLDAYRFWAVGSVAGRDMDVFWQVLPFMVVGLVVALFNTRALNLLQLGEETAVSLGIHPLVHRIVGVAAVMLLTGAATAACGPIGFVGLVVPHVARALAGVDYRWVLPYSALIGALLLLAADIIGRVIARPAEVQVGIVMALVGGPVFIYIVRHIRTIRI